MSWHYWVIDVMTLVTYWIGGTLKSTDHKDYQWVSIEQLRSYDFASADKPFVNKLLSGGIEL